MMTTFGVKEEGIEYIWKPAVYGLIFNDQKIAVVQTKDGKLFLPGGGIEHGETHEACLKREAREEIGMDITIGKFAGCARRYFFSPNEDRYILSEGYFYLCEIGKQVGRPTEEDHELKWIGTRRAIADLFHEHQSWAVHEASTLLQT
ncbi:NUDIX domain-containing protein [Bacillus sonorensis]|nr:MULTISPECIES: NUDIX domain-containing protein [Bacillus]TWK79245.1 hypothetical protein CHCC20335_0022 [Bacillus paralicheniformis]MCF7616764.1 NUDIX domain-containing protein [Bacillus sonorensis]MCZ0073186.1 NUDIX domain-containing protein [Bacillus sonorensis]MCZ0091808.1 NUDIX domain-containing protein [Bacillus sonorensis]MEC1427978.1 NUDIX domain-containing protein [Bacillus sonorensis]